MPRIVARYIKNMIISFRHKGLETLYRTDSARGVNPSHVRKLMLILTVLDSAKSTPDLALPAFRLHKLKGDLKDHWSIWVNGNWRVTFRFIGTDIELVDYQDYH